MRILLCSVLALGVVVIPCGHRADACGCGDLNSVRCPGCVAVSPNGCSCGLTLGYYDCLDNLGNVQTGTLVQCKTDHWTFTLVDEHPLICQAEFDQVCSTSKTCRPLWTPPCQPISNACDWLFQSQTSAFPYVEMDPNCIF